VRHLGLLRLSFAILSFVIALADCGGGGGGGAGGVLPSTGANNATTTLSVGSSNPYTTATGQIASLISGGFTMQVNGTTVTAYTGGSSNNYGPKAAVGVYAMVVGTPGTSNSINAIAVSTSTTAFASVTVSGPVSGWDVKDGFTIQGGVGVGYINIYVLPNTTINGSPTIRVGENVSVTGVGSVSTQIAASTITVKSATAAPSTSPSPVTSPVPTPTSAPTATPTLTPTPVPTAAPSNGPTISVPAGVRTWSGPVVGFMQGGFEIHAPNGYTNVYTNSNTTVVGTLQKGEYAQATGTGSPYTKVQGIYVSAYGSQPGNETVSGTVTSSTSYGFTLNASASYPSVPIILNSSTIVAGATLAVGASVQVIGAGSEGQSILAAQVVVATPVAPPTPTPAPIAQTHVVTADYLGSPWGSTSISWAAAAPFLSWAEVSPANASAIRAAGIKTQLYVDPNRTATTDPMYSSVESEFAHDCSGNRITTLLNGQTLYVMDVTASTLQQSFAQYTAQYAGSYDAVFEDDSGPLSDFTYSQFSAMPCNYSDAAWISGGESLNDASAVPVIANGLSATGTSAISPAIQLLASSNTIGGAMEGCYASPSIVKATGTYWVNVEDTELEVGDQNKIFECYANGPGSSGTNPDARLYVYASFLLGYNPSTSVLWEMYSTGTGFNVNPETGLVALDPKVPTPASISSLQQAGGTYGREYQECFLHGQFVGACAVVVNPDAGSPHIFPFPQYTHTLVLSGGGVLDGGTVSTTGPPPPEYLAAGEAAIAFP
jgi:hypothetical protein